MKITRGELNLLIESYLAEDLIVEKLRHQRRAEVYIPRCDFKMDPDFLQIIEFVRTGVVPSGVVPRNQDKPDFFNPAFITAVTQQALPFMNLLVAPQFGVKTKCDTLQKLQALFNETYEDFARGFKTQTRTKLSPKEKRDREKRIEAKIPGIHKQYFKQFPSMIRRNNIVLTKDRYSPIVDSPPSGLTNAELVYASMILGDLSKASTDNRKAVGKIIQNFENPGRIDTFSDLVKLCEPSKNIPGYDATGIKALFDASSTFWSRDPIGGAMDLVMVTTLVFDKLETAGIL